MVLKGSSQLHYSARRFWLMSITFFQCKKVYLSSFYVSSQTVVALKGSSQIHYFAVLVPIYDVDLIKGVGLIKSVYG